ncbi:epidermal retinol dehydrogenase 2-like protein, partial [Leptotrombidium deliense]
FCESRDCVHNSSLDMENFLEKCKYLLLIIYFILEAIVLKFIPKRFWSKSIAEEIVLVTGAGSGLGRLLALKLSSLVSQLVLWDIDENGLTETAKLVKDAGGRCKTYVVDVSDRSMVYKTSEQIREEVGVVTMLINNAGIVNGKKLLQLSDERIVKTFEVNTLAHFWICKAFLPDLVKLKRGHIVTISSVVGFFGASHMTDYSGSKFAATRFHESLMLELKDSGYDDIHFTLVCPFFMNTQMFQGAKTGLLNGLTADYVADQIIEAIKTNQDYLYLPKPFYPIHTLLTMMPTRSLYAMSRMMGSKSIMTDFIVSRSSIIFQNH